MKRKAERVAGWRQGAPKGPVRIEIHPTNRCNLKCRFCWQTTATKDAYSLELSDERLIDVVHQAHGLDVKEWIVSGGGEPMVRGSVSVKVMELIKEYGMWGQLTTNGVLLNEDRARRLVEIGWDQIQFSLDGPTAEIHDYLRDKEGTFDAAVRNAGMLSYFKRKLKRDAPYLGFNTVLCAKNFDHMEGMIELAYKVGFQLVYFEPIYAGYLEQERLALTEEEKAALPKYAKAAKKLGDRLGVATNADRFIETRLVDKSDFEQVVLRETEADEDAYVSAPCYQPWYLMGIKGCGLAGCCSTFEEGERIQEKTLQEVWFGALFNRLRGEMLSKDLPEYCAKCSVVVVMDNKEIRKHLKGFVQ